MDSWCTLKVARFPNALIVVYKEMKRIKNEYIYWLGTKGRMEGASRRWVEVLM